MSAKSSAARLSEPVGPQYGLCDYRGHTLNAHEENKECKNWVLNMSWPRSY